MTDAAARKAAMKKFPKVEDPKVIKIRLACMQISKRVAYRDGLIDGYKKAVEDLQKKKVTS